jgi:hypothetical protein
MMKRILLTAAFLAAGCASTQKDIAIIRPEIELLQLVAPVDVGYATGPTQIQFETRVANRSAEPITLRRIEISSVSNGSYALRRESFNYKETIAPDHFTSVKFWAHAYAFATGRDRQPSSEPVTVRAVVYFDSPVGSFQQIVTKYITQFPGQQGPR